MRVAAEKADSGVGRPDRALRAARRAAPGRLPGCRPRLVNDGPARRGRGVLPAERRRLSRPRRRLGDDGIREHGPGSHRAVRERDGLGHGSDTRRRDSRNCGPSSSSASRCSRIYFHDRRSARLFATEVPAGVLASGFRSPTAAESRPARSCPPRGGTAHHLGGGRRRRRGRARNRPVARCRGCRPRPRRGPSLRPQGCDCPPESQRPDVPARRSRAPAGVTV